MTDPRTKRQEKEWNRRHEEILAAAADLFAAQGFEATTVREIAEQSGFSVGYLYKHFDGKPDILHELMETHIGTVEEMSRGVERETGLSPLQRYRRFLDLFCRYIEEFRSLLPLFIQQDEAMPRRFHHRLLNLRAIDISRLDDAVEAGELPPVDTGLLGALLDGVLWNVIKYFVHERPDDPLGLAPDAIDELVLIPLSNSASRPTGKDHSSS